MQIAQRKTRGELAVNAAKLMTLIGTKFNKDPKFDLGNVLEQFGITTPEERVALSHMFMVLSKVSRSLVTLIAPLDEVISLSLDPEGDARVERASGEMIARLIDEKCTRCGNGVVSDSGECSNCGAIS